VLARNNSVSLRNEMTAFYLLQMTQTLNVPNRMASFRFGAKQNRYVR